MQQRLEPEAESRGDLTVGPEGKALLADLTPQESQEIIRRAELIRSRRETEISAEALAAGAREFGIQEQDLRDAARELADEKARKAQRGYRFRIGTTIAAALLVLMLIFSYNSLNTGQLAVDRARANLQSTLQRRADLVPQVTQLVRESAGGQEGLVDRLGSVQSGLKSPDVGAQLEASSELANLARNEGRTLQSRDAYRDLMAQVEGSENRIAVARQRYNDAATDYNRAAQSFPRSLVRPLLGFPRQVPLLQGGGATPAIPQS